MFLFRKFLAFLLPLALVVSIFSAIPSVAYAESDPPIEEQIEEIVYPNFVSIQPVAPKSEMMRYAISLDTNLEIESNILYIYKEGESQPFAEYNKNKHFTVSFPRPISGSVNYYASVGSNISEMIRVDSFDMSTWDLEVSIDKTLNTNESLPTITATTSLALNAHQRIVVTEHNVKKSITSRSNTSTLEYVVPPFPGKSKKFDVYIGSQDRNNHNFLDLQVENKKTIEVFRDQFVLNSEMVTTEYTTNDELIEVSWVANMPLIGNMIYVANEKTGAIIHSFSSKEKSGIVKFKPEYLGAEDEAYRLYLGTLIPGVRTVEGIDIESAGQLMNTKNSDWSTSISAEYYTFDTEDLMPLLYYETNQPLIKNKHYFNYINIDTKRASNPYTGQLNRGGSIRYYTGTQRLMGVVSTLQCSQDCMNNEAYLNSILAESNIIEIKRAPWSISISADRLYGGSGWSSNIAISINQKMESPILWFGNTAVMTGVDNKYQIYVCDTISNICHNKKFGTSHSPESEIFPTKNLKFKAFVAAASAAETLSIEDLQDIQAESNEIKMSPVSWYVKLNSYEERPYSNKTTPKTIIFNFTANKTIKARANSGAGAFDSPFAAFLVERSTGKIKSILQTSSTPSQRSIFHYNTTIDDDYSNYIIYIAEKAGAGSHISQLNNIVASTDGPYITREGNTKDAVEKIKNTIGGGDISKLNCEKACYGDPINPLTGELFENDEDIKVDSISPLSFIRSFSTNQKDVLGSFGYGTRHNFDMKLTQEEDYLRIAQENGSISTFRKIVIDDVTTEFANINGANVSIEETDDYYVFKRVNKSFMFNKISGSLEKIKDKLGNEITLEYNSSNKLSKLIGPEFTLQINWDNSLISSINYLNQAVSYTYDSNQRLIKVEDTTIANDKKYFYDDANRIIKIKQFNGGEYTNTYDSSHRVVEQENPLGGKTKFEYGTNETVMTMPTGVKIKEIYDSNGQMTKKVVADGTPLQAEFIYTYNSNGNVTSEKLPQGLNISYRYDDRGNVTYKKKGAIITRMIYDLNDNLIKTINPDNTITEFIYDENNQHVKTVNEGGSELFNVYDTTGKLIETGTNNSDESIKYYYNNKNLLIKETNRLHADTTYLYDNNRNLLKVTSPLGKELTNIYDSKNRLIESTSNGIKIETSYDGANRAISEVSPTSDSSYIYDAMDNVTKITTNGLSKTFEYDTSGRLVKEIDPKGNETEYAYNELGLISQIKINGEIKETNLYNKDGQIISKKDALDNETIYTYYIDNLSSVKFQNGSYLSYSYDSSNRLITESSPGNKSISYKYNSTGEVISKIHGGTIETYEYDLNGNLLTTKLPNGKVETRSYDKDDRLIKIVDYFGNEKEYLYDNDGKLLKTTENQTKEIVNSYDVNDRLKKVDYDEFAINYEYDTKNRLIEESKTGQAAITYTYDSKSNVTARGPPNKKVEYTYNNFNEITKVSYPSNLDVSYEYGDLGNLTKVKNGNTELVNYEYDANLNNTKSNFSNSVVESRTFDNTSNLTNFSISQANQSLFTKTLAYDVGNYIASSDANYNEEISNEKYSYLYNTRGVLASVKNLSNNKNKILEFDVYKNNTKAGVNQFTYSNNKGHLETSLVDTVKHSYTYDNAGNRLSKVKDNTPSSLEEYTWTVDNKLENYENSDVNIDFSYDASGLLSKKSQGNSTENFVWDYISSSLPVLLEDGDNYYIYGVDNAPFAQINKDNNEIEFLHGDERGSKILSTDATGEVLWAKSYDEYGNVLQTSETSTNSSNFAYAGEYFDEDLKLYNLRARWYDTTTASFISVDPLSSVTGERYSYASGNPVMNSDPTGLFSVSALARNSGIAVIGALDGLTGFSLAADLTNAIAPGTINKCLEVYAVTAGVVGIASFLIPGGGIAKAGIALTKIGKKIYGIGRNGSEYFIDYSRIAKDPVKFGQIGPYSTLTGVKGDNLTAHHMPSSGFIRQERPDLNHNKGMAFVLTHEQHKQTRTFAGSNNSVLKTEAGLDFNEVLKRDLDDLVKITKDTNSKKAFLDAMNDNINDYPWFNPKYNF